MQLGNAMVMPDIDRNVSHIAARQHGVFAIAQVPSASPAMIKSRVAGRRWIRVQRGVFAVNGAPDTWERRLWVALLIAGEGSVVGRRSCLRLVGLAWTASDHVDIVQPERTVPGGRPRTSRRTSSLPADHVTDCKGIPATTVERTLCDLAGITSYQRRRRGWVWIPEAQVERLVDDALARELVSVRSLADTHRSLAGRGRAGTILMRRLLEERSEGYVATESELEALFVRLLAAHGLPPARRQVLVGSEEASIGRVDFVFDSCKLVVEADGRRYHGQKTATLRDRERDLELLAAGWQLLRVDWWQLVNDGPNVARLLGRILRRRSAD